MLLNERLINSVNNLSHFDVGNGMNKRAEKSLKLFDDNFPLTDDLSDQQKEFLKESKIKYQEFIINLYNEALTKRSKWCPVNVCGPANYDFKKQDKLSDKYMEFMAYIPSKINDRLKLIEKKLNQLTPIEKQLEYIRETGDAGVISSDDPHALEKLKAKLEHYERVHEMMIKANAYKRKHKTLIGFDGGLSEEDCKTLSKTDGPAFAPYQLSGSNRTKKEIKSRIERLEKMANLENKEYEKSWGKVVLNYELKRIQFFFNEKPSEEVRNLLKSRAFRWSPKNNAWQRVLTNEGIYITKIVLNDELLKS